MFPGRYKVAMEPTVCSPDLIVFVTGSDDIHKPHIAMPASQVKVQVKERNCVAREQPLYEPRG